MLRCCVVARADGQKTDAAEWKTAKFYGKRRPVVTFRHAAKMQTPERRKDQTTRRMLGGGDRHGNRCVGTRCSTTASCATLNRAGDGRRRKRIHRSAARGHHQKPDRRKNRGGGCLPRTDRTSDVPLSLRRLWPRTRVAFRFAWHRVSVADAVVPLVLCQTFFVFYFLMCPKRAFSIRVEIVPDTFGNV